MPLKLIYIYFLFLGIKLLSISFNFAFVSGFVVLSIDEFVLIRTINSNSNFYYLGPYGFDFMLFILGHSVLFFGLFSKLNRLFYYLFFILLLYLSKIILYKFFGHYENSPGLANLFFYFYDLLVFWILELGLFPISLYFVKSSYE